jgi:hypothetical protein
MLDFSHIPQNLRSNFSVLYNDSSTPTWQVWNKPRGITSVYVLCIGPGGNGATNSGASLTNIAGGGGGGSGGITTLLIQANLIPDIIYVQPGINGAGTGSFVSLQPSTTAAYVLCYANRGGNATTSTGGAAGAAATATNMILGSYGDYNAYAGQAGASGSAGAVGGSVTWGSLIVSGGAAGGGRNSSGTNFAGGSITGAGFMPTVSGGAAGSNPGFPGLSFNQPLMFCGGSGGGGNNTASGAGGRGNIGSGGGGGGAWLTGNTPSVAGSGGIGLVLIWGF